MSGEGGLVEVKLISFPLRLYERSMEHWDGLMREFALLRMDTAVPGQVPGRLLDLVERLEATYSRMASEGDEARDRALAEGREVVDLTYRVPPGAGQAAAELRRTMAEADEYCRSGNELLTVARPEEIRLFGEWFLDQFTSQLDGQPPRSWPEWRASATTSGPPGT